MEAWKGKLDLYLDQVIDATKEGKDLYCIRKDIHGLFAEHIEGQYDEGYKDGEEWGKEGSHERGYEEAEQKYRDVLEKIAKVLKDSEVEL